jgi:signal peptidase I
MLSGLQTLASGAAYALIIITVAFQVARVDGLSMEPTLKDQDRLIVNRLTYQFGDPRSGDIVMLHYPRNPAMLFVKRVIAGEGDVVRSEDGTVYVNDVPLRDDYVYACRPVQDSLSKKRYTAAIRPSLAMMKSVPAYSGASPGRPDTHWTRPPLPNSSGGTMG